jgi:hypothetical protein
MSCPLLDKLAPETRNLIYEYALRFDAPLKHVQHMVPFIEKYSQSTESETEIEPREERSAVSDSFNRANTSLLTTSKLIYTEAIVAFYKSNAITFNSRILARNHITTILATDLALATQVLAKLHLSLGNEHETKVALIGSTKLLLTGFRRMFPKLNAGSVYVYTDAGLRPVVALFIAANALRLSGLFHTVQFERVGLVAAYPKDDPQLRLVVQCQSAIDDWDHGGIEASVFSNLSVRNLHRNSEGMPPGTVDNMAQRLFDSGQARFLPPDYPVFEAGSHEFWTITSDLMREAALFAREMARSTNFTEPAPQSESESEHEESEEDSDEDV